MSSDWSKYPLLPDPPQLPQWLLNSMCAIWNSGIKVIYAKDRMGDDNYPNAYWHGMNSCIISEYLPKLVNE